MNFHHAFLVSLSLVACNELQAITTVNDAQKTRASLQELQDTFDSIALNFSITRDENFDSASWQKIIALISDFITECETTQETPENHTLLASKFGEVAKNLMLAKGQGITGNISIAVGAKENSEK